MKPLGPISPGKPLFSSENPTVNTALLTPGIQPWCCCAPRPPWTRGLRSSQRPRGRCRWIFHQHRSTVKKPLCPPPEDSRRAVTTLGRLRSSQPATDRTTRVTVSSTSSLVRTQQLCDHIEGTERRRGAGLAGDPRARLSFEATEAQYLRLRWLCRAGLAGRGLLVPRGLLAPRGLLGIPAHL